MEPADDAPSRDPLRRTVYKIVLVEFVIADAGGLQRGAYFRIAVFRTIVDVARDKGARISENLVPDVKRRADRSARIVGSGLNVDVLEGRLLEYFAVRGTVQGYASGETEFLLCGLLVHVAQQCEIIPFQNCLYGS